MYSTHLLFRVVSDLSPALERVGLRPSVCHRGFGLLLFVNVTRLYIPFTFEGTYAIDSSWMDTLTLSS